MPARPAMAVKCSTALVEPPIAISTRSAFSTDRGVTIRSGVRPLRASRIAARPVASAARSRSAWTAGIAALPGRIMPRASAIEAIVLAVPITAQVPAVVARLPSISRISSVSISPARYLAQKRRQSVQAPSRSPCQREVIMGPATSPIAGRLAEIAPISWAGTVLSQPPTSTTASIGWARIISSVSIAIRLRNIRLVGLRNTSPSEIVGNLSGKPPSASTPRSTAAISSGKCRWQLLKPEDVSAMPITGRASRSVE